MVGYTNNKKKKSCYKYFDRGEIRTHDLWLLSPVSYLYTTEVISEIVLITYVNSSKNAVL